MYKLLILEELLSIPLKWTALCDPEIGVPVGNLYADSLDFVAKFSFWSNVRVSVIAKDEKLREIHLFPDLLSTLPGGFFT